MKPLDKLDKKELREFLNKGWMTHDGMWFYHCLQEFGIEKANKLNKATISSLAPVEMRRIKRAVGIEDIQTLEQLKELLEAAIEIVTGDFMNFNYSYPSENVVHWEFEAQKCWAYVGVKSMGVIDQYQCGVMHRIGCWLDSAGIEHSFNPQVRGCLMHASGNCCGDITITDERLARGKGQNVKPLDKLDQKELKELLSKCWMTHDGMWFYHCLQEFGIEKTNKLNLAATRAMAAIEARRIKKALGIEHVQTFEQLKEFLEGACELLKPDFMKFTYSFPSENVWRWEWEREQCWAYNGIKSMGVIAQYQCGAYDRPAAWLDELGIKYSITPELKGCMMHNTGECFREFRLHF